MTQLSLWFNKHNDYVLERSTFSHPLIESELRAVRGKRAGAYQGYNTFQWTPALKAMTILLTKTVASRLRAESDGPILQGCESSPASSFDYALGKNPSWILDMFGMDKAGNPIARKLFNRTNPERKRGGDVLISVNQKALDGRDILIYLNESRSKDANEIDLLANSIEKSWIPHGGHANSNKIVRLHSARKDLKNSHAHKTNLVESEGNISQALACPCCGEYLSFLIQRREERLQAYGKSLYSSSKIMSQTK